MSISPPFDPTPPNPLRYVDRVLPQIGHGFDSILHIALKAAANVSGVSHAQDIASPQPGTPPGTSTLGDYCRLNRIKVKPKRRKDVAFQLVSMTRAAGFPLPTIPDRRFSKINCYPLAILNEWSRRLQGGRA